MGKGLGTDMSKITVELQLTRELLKETCANYSNLKEDVADVRVQLRDISEQTHQSSTEIALLHQAVSQVEVVSNKLLKFVSEGDGKPSLIERVGRVEDEANQLRTWRNEQDTLDSIVKHARIKGQWRVKAAFIVGILALIASILNFLLHQYVRQPDNLPDKSSRPTSQFARGECSLHSISQLYDSVTKQSWPLV